MNERIKELAEQAALLGPSSRVGNAHEATEKFAELIVRECVQSLDRNVVYEILCSDEIPTKDNHWEGFVSEKIITDTANQIKKHFGVE